mmetsp:Transcript_3064/g.4377  ORF Transcript_3064/g.4377 Transcript_3064/m.4377 type:complete len:240 (+) Transcript_3064:625-1344(+)
MLVDPTTCAVRSWTLMLMLTLSILEPWVFTDTEHLEVKSLRDTLMLPCLEVANPTFSTPLILDLFTMPLSVLMLSSGNSIKRTITSVLLIFTRVSSGEPTPPKLSVMNVLSTASTTMVTTVQFSIDSSCKLPWVFPSLFTEREDKPVPSFMSPIPPVVSKLPSTTLPRRGNVLRSSIKLLKLDVSVMLLIWLLNKLELMLSSSPTLAKRPPRTSWMFPTKNSATWDLTLSLWTLDFSKK